MQTMTIGRLAELGGVNVDTVRYYERQKLLPPPPRSPSGYREYSQDDVDRLHFIRRSKELGFTLAEIAELLSLTANRDSDMRGVKRKAEQRLSQVEGKIEEQSEPDENRFVWANHIRIENDGSETIQLLNRHWRITDALGRTQEVRGPGVVGEQPVLEPGETYEYSSGTPLSTPSGIMVGSYEMEILGGDRFDVAIPAFSLDSPYEQSRVH